MRGRMVLSVAVLAAAGVSVGFGAVAAATPGKRRRPARPRGCIATSDGGRASRLVAADMPPALPGEFAFAASGQWLVSAGGGRA